ncbi:uncharacterized protein LOC128712762 [Anopheles marshallii]|uniref:uncharacterized protein LOC128712762 n=1 Tax=Anopheles marshallii TaxID=1521116 RepID=UPI00237B729D|nr:uncharacterized protein LOC128712762 [Anopheles marshallii]
MFGDKLKQKIEAEYKRHFVPGDNSMENVQQSDNEPVKTEVTDQPGETMDVVQQRQEQRPPDSSSNGEESDTTQEDGNSSRGEVKKLRGFFKKPRNALERKKHDKERKVRQLRRFRKFLMPKNAIMALHELQGPGMAEFTLNSIGREMKAEVMINNVKYEATAPNKNLAKAKVSEKALREVILAQMTRMKQQRIAQQKQQQQQSQEHAVTPEVTMEDEGMDGIEPDDLPMEHLASFALHKLFAEWEAEGFEVPILKMTRGKLTTQAPASGEKGAGPSLIPKITKTVADLPPNAAKYHPTALFAYMRPQVTFEDLGLNIDQQNREFSVGVKCDGQQFIGKGRSKKLARKAAAADACKELFGVVFDESVPNVSSKIEPIPVHTSSTNNGT